MLKSPTGPLQILASAFLLFAAIAILATAWGFQLSGAEPCELCYAERIPYYAGMPLALIALVSAARDWSPLITRGALILFGLLMVYGTGLSIYHVGVEWEWWQGPTACSGDALSGPTSATDLLGQMQMAKVVSCKEVTVWIFGLSLATWNVVSCFGLALVALVAGFIRRRAIVE